jgi:phospholipase/carboxylesterase
MTYTVEYSNRPEEREGTHLVLLLHGFGSHERDLLGLTPHLPNTGITYAGMRAPQPVGAVRESDDAVSAVIPGVAMGYQWWPLTGGVTNAATDHLGVKLATQYVVEFLESIREMYSGITLLGFSQGMAISTSVARHRPDLVASVIGLSGFVVDGAEEFFNDEELIQKQIPLFYGRGDSDPVIHANKVAFTDAWLPGKVQLDFHLYPGLPHAVNAEEIGDVTAFIEKNVLN